MVFLALGQHFLGYCRPHYSLDSPGRFASTDFAVAQIFHARRLLVVLGRRLQRNGTQPRRDVMLSAALSEEILLRRAGRAPSVSSRRENSIVRQVGQSAKCAGVIVQIPADEIGCHWRAGGFNLPLFVPAIMMTERTVHIRPWRTALFTAAGRPKQMKANTLWLSCVWV